MDVLWDADLSGGFAQVVVGAEAGKGDGFPGGARVGSVEKGRDPWLAVRILGHYRKVMGEGYNEFYLQ